MNNNENRLIQFLLISPREKKTITIIVIYLYKDTYIVSDISVQLIYTFENRVVWISSRYAFMLLWIRV